MKTALLISTYNWPEALELIFLSIKKQSILPYEILIADDGSNEKTKNVIDHFIKETNLNIIHVWQEDKGFRKSMILNKTIAVSKADYIIQIDGDCIIHKHFVEDHIKNCKINHFLFGSRVNILAPFVNEIFNKKITSFSFFSNEIRNKTRTIYLPFLANFFKPQDKISKKFRGCNVSYWRNDIISINGYNEDFEGWGREDSDLAIRMLNNGISGKRLKFCAILFHIYHKENSKNSVEINNNIEQNTIKNKITKIEKGIDQYL
jgi:glycosyltransferase involved in cell wall biosynthesis